MRKTIFFFLICCATQLFGQVNMQWEALPAQENSAAEIVYQTPQGFLLAQLPLAKKIMMSKDDAKTWQTLTFQDSLPYYRFVSDKTGGIYCYGLKKICKLDTSQNVFKPLLTIGGLPYNNVVDMAFKGDKMYVSATNELLIYDINTLQLIFSKPYLNLDVTSRLILGKGNKNYVKTEKSSTGVDLKSFDDDGSNYTELGKKSELKFAQEVYMLHSGKLILLKGTALYVSEDEGNSLQKKIDLGVDQLFVNSKNEIIIRRGTTMQSSSDEGKTWENIPVKNIFGNAYFFNNDSEKIIFASRSCYTKTFLISKDKGITWSEQSITLDKPQTFEILLTPENDILIKKCTFFDETKLHNKPTWKKNKNLDSFDFSKVYILPSGKWMVRGGYSSIDGWQTVIAPNWYTSTDKGNTWQVHHSFPDSNSPNVDRNLHFNQLKQLLYITFDKYYISKDEGLTWEEFDNVDFQVGNSSGVLMLKNYIFYSSDNWFNIYNQTTKENKSLNAVKNKSLNDISAPLSLKDDKIVFVSSSTSGKAFLYISADFGVTFVTKKMPVNQGGEIVKLINGENNSLILLTYDNLYISYDEGTTWLSIKGNLPNGITYSTIAISNDNLLYVGMKGGPIYKTKTSLNNSIKTKDAFSENIVINIYPNPTTDELNIQIADNQDNVSNILIYSIDAKLLQQTQFYGNSTSLNVQQLPQGIYLLQLKNGAKTITKRFVKN